MKTDFGVHVFSFCKRAGYQDGRRESETGENS